MMLRRLVITEHIRRRLAQQGARRLASKTSDESASTVIGTTSHIPAPEETRPEVSPITQLGTEDFKVKNEETEVKEEPITFLGSEEKREKAEKKEEKVIRWIGSKPEGLEESYAKAQETSPATPQVRQRKHDVAPVEYLAFDLMPKLMSALKSPKLRQAIDIADALKNIVEESSKDYDDTVRIDLVLAVDPRKSNQFVRGWTVLPHGTGKTPRIAVFADGTEAQKAREAEVEYVGGAELIQEVLEKPDEMLMRFDKCIATPAMMAAGMSKLGRILGPRGLMPNPKTGTLTDNVMEAITKIRQGQVEFRVDRMGTVRSALGKASFGVPKLLENTSTFGSDVLHARPEMFQKKPPAQFIRKITLSSTNGRGFPVTLPSLMSAISRRQSL